MRRAAPARRAGRRRRPLTADLVAAAAEAACLLEARAPKPGNVSPGRDRPGLAYRDFLVSAAVLGETMRRHAGAPVGRLALHAVRATRRQVGTNTNLGIVLLFAPLARAALDPGVRSRERGRRPSLRRRLRHALQSLDVADARLAYAAIRHARPGGLGRACDQDIRRTPTLTLLDCMRLAAPRDGVARQYASAYADVFATGLPTLRRWRRRGRPMEEAIVACGLALLARAPDTLVARRHGSARALAVSRRAAAALRRGGPATPAGRRALRRLDAFCRAARPPLNPGTTADLVAATLFVWLLQSAERRAQSSRSTRAPSPHGRVRSRRAPGAVRAATAANCSASEASDANA